MKNKKADIAITILVIGVIALCAAALFSFYAVEKRVIGGGVNSVFYLQEVYNLAESVKYSGVGLYKSYGDDVNYKDGRFIIEKEFLDGDLKITYNFAP